MKKARYEVTVSNWGTGKVDVTDKSNAANPQDAIKDVLEPSYIIIPSKLKAINSAEAVQLKQRGYSVVKVVGEKTNYYVIEFMPNPFLKIRKAPTVKLAFRLTDEASIPAFLRQAVTINGDKIKLQCLEGPVTLTRSTIKETIQTTNPVIAYEILDPSKVQIPDWVKPASDGKYYNVWWKKNASTTLKERDGVFYDIPKELEAQLVTKTLLPFSTNDKPTAKPTNGGWAYKVSWQNEPLVTPLYRSVWVRYGENDFNAVALGTDSAKAYYVIGENGVTIGDLDTYMQTKVSKFEFYNNKGC